MIYNSYDNVGLVRVLTFLKSHNSEYISGQDLSQVLKISRVAVWKHIDKIKKLGYKIDSKQKLGYRLTGITNLLLPWEITDGLKTQFLGQRAYYFDSIDSTQNFASTIAENPKENGAVIISQKQTKGRGRLGRKWISPQGGIWLSIIIHPKFDVSVTTLFPIAASLALSLAIEKTLKIKPELKWPNDVTIKGKKVAGMLVDLSLESNQIQNLVLGVGINFKVNEKTIKNSITTANFYGATSLVDKTSEEKPLELIQKFLEELEKIIELLNQKKNNLVVKNWSKRSSTLGKTIVITSGTKKIKGKAMKIDGEGALSINSKGKNQRILAGDVSY